MFLAFAFSTYRTLHLEAEVEAAMPNPTEGGGQGLCCGREEGGYIHNKISYHSVKVSGYASNSLCLPY